MEYRQQLLTLGREYARLRGISVARVATLVHDQGAFFKKLEEGKSCTMDTYEKVLRWFAQQWPEDKSWPDDVPRPEIPKDAAAESPDDTKGQAA